MVAEKFSEVSRFIYYYVTLYYYHYYYISSLLVTYFGFVRSRRIWYFDLKSSDEFLCK